MVASRICFLILTVAVFCFPAAGADQWAVVIGISEYKNLPENQWLQFSHADARMFADRLKSRATGVPPEHVKVLTDKEATTSEIKRAVGNWLNDHSKSDDTVYIYFAGHGVVDQRNKAYFVTYDTEPENLVGTALEMTDLKRLLQDLQFKHLIVFSDACKSARIGKDDSSRDFEVTPRINDALKDIITENRDLPRSQFVFAAAGNGEKSLESAQWGDGHGAFTYFVEEGLKGNADSDSNGAVTANELYDFVRQKVQQATQGKQNPVIASAEFNGNLVLSTLDGVSRSSLSTSLDSAQTALRERGNIVVISDTPGTLVSVDNRDLGFAGPDTPLNLTVQPGTHLVVGSRGGSSAKFTKEIDISSEGTDYPLQIRITLLSNSNESEWRSRLAEAQMLLGTNRREGLSKLESIFGMLLSLRGNRELSREEDAVTVDVVLALIQEYATQKAPAQVLKSLASRYLGTFRFLPEPVGKLFSADPRLSDSVGRVFMDIEPSPSTVEIDSVPYGDVTGPRVLWVSPGVHHFKLTRLGYATEEADVVVKAGTSEPLQRRLRLGMLSLILFSETPEVDVLTGGRVVTTFRPAGQMRERLRPDQVGRVNREIQRRGLKPQVQVAVISNIDPAASAIELEFNRDRYKPRAEKVDLTSHLDQIYAAGGDYVWDGIIELDKMVGQLRVESSPSGADVIIDNKKIGSTPLQTSYEIGTFDVIIELGVWRNNTRISIRNSEMTAVETTLKAPIVFLGVHSPVVAADKLRDIEARITDLLPRVLTKHIPDRQNADRYEYTRDFLKSALSAKASLVQHLLAMKDRFGSELFLFGVYLTEQEYLSGNLKFFLFSSFTSRPDVRDVSITQVGAIESFLKDLDSTTFTASDLFKPYIGLTTLDTELAGRGVVALKIDDGSPAERAGIRRGDAIIKINGEAATSSKISEYVANHSIGALTLLEVENRTGPRTVPVESIPLPKLLIAPATRGFVGESIAELTAMKTASSADTEDKKNVIAMNEALAYAAADDWVAVNERLGRFAEEAPNAFILRAAVYYYRGLSFEQLNDRTRARDWYQKAKAEKNTVLQSDLAFDFQTLASWRLDYLK